MSDWSSDVCSSDLRVGLVAVGVDVVAQPQEHVRFERAHRVPDPLLLVELDPAAGSERDPELRRPRGRGAGTVRQRLVAIVLAGVAQPVPVVGRSEEHTSELQSLMRISYAVFCLKKKNNQ